jgi:hypothetical protein
MTQQLVEAEASEAVKSLAELAGMIREQIQFANEAANAAARPYWLRTGQLLAQAKSKFLYDNEKRPREFYDWVERQFGLRRRSCDQYMLAAKSTTNDVGLRIADSQSLRGALKAAGHETGKPNPKSWVHPIREELKLIDFAALRKEHLKRVEERALQKQLALKLIDIGFKVLAVQLHPDKKGGSRRK